MKHSLNKAGNKSPRPFVFVMLTRTPYLSAVGTPSSGDSIMKTKVLVLAAVAVMSLTAAIVPIANAASTIAGDAKATRMQQSGSYSGGGG
jgi:hypothetical protein